MRCAQDHSAGTRKDVRIRMRGNRSVMNTLRHREIITFINMFNLIDKVCLLKQQINNKHNSYIVLKQNVCNTIYCIITQEAF